MKRMLRMSAGVVAGLGVLAGGTWVLSRTIGNHETLYEGKPIYYWSIQATNQDAAASNKTAAVVFSQIVPRLTNQMFSDTNDSKLRLALIDQLNALPGIQINFAAAAGRRVQAANELGMLGPCAKSAAPALLVALKDQDEVLCESAAKALAAIQAEAETAVPALIACLVDHEGEGRADVAEALGKYGPRAKAAVPMLVKLLQATLQRSCAEPCLEPLKQIGAETVAGGGAPAPSPQAND